MTARTAAVLAGGLGTRVASLTGGVLPKALLPVSGRPFIEHKLDELRSAGVDRVVLLLSVHADQLVDHVGDGRRWGLAVTTVLDGDRMRGTGGAVRHALNELPERFWVTYGDTLLSADLVSAEQTTATQGWSGAMTVLHNNDRWQPSNVSVHDGLVIGYEKGAPPGTHQFIDYGLLYLEADSFRAVDADTFDLQVVLAALIADRALGAVEVTQKFRDIGTPEALTETEGWLRTGREAGA